MRRKQRILLLFTLLLLVSLTACKGGSESTISGMVMSVNGSVLSVQEIDAENMNFQDGGQPKMPSNMEGFELPEDFSPEDFDGEWPQRPSGMEGGEMPEGFSPKDFDGKMPEWNGERPQRPSGMEGGEMPEGFSPEDFDGEMPEWDGERPQRPSGMEGGEMPEGFSPEDFDGKMPEWDGERPQRPDGGDMQQPSSENGNEDGNRKNPFSFGSDPVEYDISNAHITIETDGERASGSLDDITQGSLVTLTLDGKGNCTNVTVTGSFSFRKGAFSSEA